MQDGVSNNLPHKDLLAHESLTNYVNSTKRNT